MVQEQPTGAQNVAGEAPMAASSLIRWSGPAAVLGGVLVMIGSFFSDNTWMLDFSHLSQTGWIAHRPSAQREAISRWLHTPLSDVGDEARRAALRKGLLRGF